MRMRTFWAMSLGVIGLLLGAGFVSRPPANALVTTGEIHRSPIVIEELTANATNLPVQSFDAF